MALVNLQINGYIPWHFPLHKETVKGASEEAKREFRNQYPDIYSHLLKYKEPLSNRREKNGISYEWYVL